MTILEAINAINKRKPNTFEESEIVGWLSELDSKIKLKIIDTHEGAYADIVSALEEKGYSESEAKKYADIYAKEMAKFRISSAALDSFKKSIKDGEKGEEVYKIVADKVALKAYGAETPSDTVLLVPEPFSCVYLSWLESCMDYANGEYDKYNNSAMKYNSDYKEFATYYNRTHVPYGTSLKFF